MQVLWLGFIVEVVAAGGVIPVEQGEMILDITVGVKPRVGPTQMNRAPASIFE